MDPENIDAINSKGVIYEQNSHYQQSEKYLPLATDWFDKTINKDENYAIGWSNKLVCLINSGFLTDAERIINLTVQAVPKSTFHNTMKF